MIRVDVLRLTREDGNDVTTTTVVDAKGRELFPDNFPARIQLFHEIFVRAGGGDTWKKRKQWLSGGIDYEKHIAELMFDESVRFARSFYVLISIRFSSSAKESRPRTPASLQDRRTLPGLVQSTPRSARHREGDRADSPPSPLSYRSPLDGKIKYVITLQELRSPSVVSPHARRFGGSSRSKTPTR